MKKGMYQNLRIFFKMIQGIFYVEKKTLRFEKKRLGFKFLNLDVYSIKSWF